MNLPEYVVSPDAPGVVVADDETNAPNVADRKRMQYNETE